MIKSLIATLALSTLCIPQVQASTYTEKDLLNTFKDLGGRVYVDSDFCKKYKGAYGLQQGVNLHLCTAPHKGNAAEWKDTIRHEIWHVVQMCNKGPISKDFAATMIASAHEKGWTAKNYKPSSWHAEAEAHYIAATRSAGEIRNALIKTCS